ncbi:sn-glycerol-1-phosphate dehydrogenase [Thermoclostridium stercorarium]|uniref:sn-glycerol-1-phosphate dehydrogenase n=1 Tax=Thermoclostridium stercorarium TaxID=1510 RepID=UPI002249985F|nr:sn-glycerol-1-phosphate dehydrogenase [Thermoclostridium stercorarium]UZQ84607.1 sn-glycerol-1-phosphate dehydrogenase [Thermoclostridium stercorarium]
MTEIMENLSVDGISGAEIKCRCGKMHKNQIKEIIIERGALAKIPDIIKKHGGSNVYVIADRNTYAAAGETVCKNIERYNLPYSLYVFDSERIEPDELAVGKAIMHYDGKCDFIVGIGSGTINDIGKMVACITGKPYMIVATAPSMDGYASATSSMIRDGIKVSLGTVCPCVIVADTEVLCNAPKILLQAGIGDMLAKYISICEWRLSHLITGEYYCEEIASMVRNALKNCMQIESLEFTEPDDIKPVIEGLIISGIAMSFAGLSRPASGMEHYFSHLWDMRAIEFNTPSALHGIQCGVATVLCLRVYEFIARLVPDRKKACDFVNSFSLKEWNRFLAGFLGRSAEGLIELERKERKYNPESHAKRLDIIVNNWDEIVKIISEELPPAEQVEKYMKKLGMPTMPKELGFSDGEVQGAFLATKDIRDKYIGSRLLWDLELLDEAKHVCRSVW